MTGANQLRSKRVAAEIPATLLAATAKVIRANSEDRQRATARSRSETTLEITAGTFEEGLKQFVEACIVPALVESFLRTRTNLPEFVTPEHNVDQT